MITNLGKGLEIYLSKERKKQTAIKDYLRKKEYKNGNGKISKESIDNNARNTQTELSSDKV